MSTTLGGPARFVNLRPMLAVAPLRVAFYGMKEFEVRGPDALWLWFAEPTDDARTECE